MCSSLDAANGRAEELNRGSILMDPPRPRSETAAAADDDGMSQPNERCSERWSSSLLVPGAGAKSTYREDSGAVGGLEDRDRWPGRGLDVGPRLGGQQPPEEDVNAIGVLDPSRDGIDDDDAANSALGLNMKLTDSFGRAAAAERWAVARAPAEREPADLLPLAPPDDDDDGPAAQRGGYVCQSERSSVRYCGCWEGRFH